MLIINPKRVNESVEVKPHWYNYYAGYSHTFTQGIIESSELNENSLILDPWNGGGTTTLMASIAGIRSVGLDLNPVMKVIATSKQASLKDIEIIKQKIGSIRSNVKVVLSNDDPLKEWFQDESAASIRKVEKSILGKLTYKTTKEKIDALTSSQCLMHTALFNTIREFLKPFIPSNPTWIKKPKVIEDKVQFAWSDFRKLYVSNIREMVKGIDIVNHDWDEPQARIDIGSSTNINLLKESIDLVLTSPPYCTRIDYGVATLPELSVIAVNGKAEIDKIRRSLMGTTTVPKTLDELSADLGQECKRFLNKVENHESKASKTYYFKNFVQYFESLRLSINEIGDVLKKNGKFVCVVQDSFYKDVHCDLPKIITQLSENNGLSISDTIEFESKQNMANVNQRSKQYRSKNVAYETVLVFEKE